MNLEIVITVLLVHHVSIGRGSAAKVMDGTFTRTAVGWLSLPFTYELFEAVRNKTGSVQLWCAMQCLGKPACYFFTGLDDKCIMCIVGIIDIDSTMQPYTPSPLPDSTQVYGKQGVTLQKLYEIGTTYVTYAGAQTACADLGMEVLTFASVQEFQTLSQLIEASPVSGGLFWVGLLREPDNTWVYVDGGPDIQDLWVPLEPNGDGPCAHMWHGYKFNDVPCDLPGRRYICQAHTVV